MSVTDVIQAFVGCPGIPRDLDSGLINFNHKSLNLTIINTCAPSILFQNTKLISSFNMFENLMKDIIFGTVGFGQE